jgi:hydroxymethylpyrimidine pyrophosphatase-like HAD family hydrolase
MSSSGDVLGTFAIYHRSAHAPETSDIELIEQTARLTSIAIERKATTEKLLQSEDRFRRLFEQAGIAAVICDPQELAFRDGALWHGEERIDLVYSASCLNVMPAGIDKAGGLYFLAEVTGIPLAAMLAVGDSPVDGPMLTVAGYSAAPANASSYIQRLAQFIAPSPAAQGVREILAHFGVV